MFNALNSDEMTNGTFIIQQSSFPIALHYIMAVLIFLVAVFSIVGNILTFLILYSQTKYSQQIKVYRMQLALSHVVAPVATYWMYFVSSLRGKWVFGQIGCSFYGFVQGFCALSSILIFAAIAFNRGHSIRALSSPPINQTIHNSIFLWITAFALSSPPLFGWNRYTIDGLGTTCCFDIRSTDMSSRAFVIYILFLGFIIPLAIIIVSYRKVFTVLLNSAMFQKRSMTLRYTNDNGRAHYNHQKWWARICSWGESMEFCINSYHIAQRAELPGEIGKRSVKSMENKYSSFVRNPSPRLTKKLEIVWRDRRSFRNHIRPMKTMLLVTVCFLCAWLPFAVLAVVQQFASLDEHFGPYLVATAGLIAKSYIALDPIVYVLTDAAFRRKMRSYFCCFGA